MKFARNNTQSRRPQPPLTWSSPRSRPGRGNPRRRALVAAAASSRRARHRRQDDDDERATCVPGGRGVRDRRERPRRAGGRSRSPSGTRARLGDVERAVLGGPRLWPVSRDDTSRRSRTRAQGHVCLQENPPRLNTYRRSPGAPRTKNMPCSQGPRHRKGAQRRQTNGTHARSTTGIHSRTPSANS